MSNQTFTDDQMIQQILWENHSIEEGVKRFREAQEDKLLVDTDNGTRILRDSIAAVVGGINEAYAEAEDALINTKGGRSTPWHLMVGLVPAEEAAVVVLKKCLEYSQTTNKQQQTTTALSKSIGEALRQQLMFNNWKQNSAIEAALEGKTKSFATVLIERAKGNVSRPTLAKWRRRFNQYENIEWGTDGISLGAFFIDLVAKTCPETFVLTTKLIRGKQTRIFTLTDIAWRAIDASNDRLELLKPFLLPTLITPKDWQYAEGKLVGGYWHLEQSLFTSSQHKHTAADTTAASSEFLESINTLQHTSWKINPYILSVLEMVQGTGKELGGIPQQCNIEIQMLDNDTYMSLSDEDRKAYHQKRQAVLEEQASSRGKHSAFTRKLAIAHKMSAFDEFYFPYFSDFRGRLYPMSQELNPQGDHIAKGLLQFTQGKAFGTKGLYWAKVHLANTFGKDKDTFEQRVDCADDVINSGELADTVEQPLNNTLWADSDEPMTFLAIAKELVEAYATSAPEAYISHLPIALDGVCNGMQILSMLGKDEVGAEKTNCKSIDERFDLYSEVADLVLSKLSQDKDDNPVAGEWFTKLYGNPAKARKVVKRAVMTQPYGVTPRGVTEQLIADRHCHGMEASRMSAAGYMKDCIAYAMESVNGKAVEIMAYFQEVAELSAYHNVPLNWVTPMGLKVTQSYYSMNRTRIKTIMGEIVLWNEDSSMGLDPAKNRLAASPNVIHSLDAAMLQLTVLKMAEKTDTSFAMIHDSYGCHAADIEQLHATLRDAAFDIFSDDFLTEFHNDMQEQLEGVDLPRVPTQGTYDINEILTAPYFFS